MKNKWQIFSVLSLVVYACVCADSRPALSINRCPEACHCRRRLRVVSCIDRQLPDIPANIPLSVQVLYLDKNHLTHLPADSFSGLTNLVVLSLTENYITGIEPGSFNGLKRLKRLSLRHNTLTLVDERVFQGLDGLTSLDLSQNHLASIPGVALARNVSKIILDSNAFSSAHFPSGYRKLEKLKTVVISNNNIKHLDHTDLLSLSSNVTKLCMSRCSLQRIANDIFSNFTALRSLKLSYNPDIEMKSIKALVVSLSGSDLTALDLSGMLGCLPADLFRPLSGVPLRTLTLAHSRFEVIPNGTFSSLSHLFHLDLSHGKLRMADNGAFKGLRSVQSLKLDHNDLWIVPSPLPGSLTTLDLSYNAMLTTIPKQTFSGLYNLINLTLSHCSLRVFTALSFDGLGSLLSLDLSHNDIGSCYIGVKVFKAVSQLETLHLDNNKMTAIKYCLFAYLPKLRNLYLSSNDCRNLSVHLFDTSQQLEVLHLEDNMLANLVKSDTGGLLFGKLTALRELHFENNGLTSLPGRMIRSLASLQELYLQENYISNWGDGFFNDATSIRLVNLTRNKVSFINESSLSGLLGKSTQLYLSANPFSCDCDLMWFRDWLDNSTGISIPDIDKCICSAPVSLAGRPLLTFHPESIKKRCFPPPWLYIIVGAVSGGVLLVIVLVAIVYANRWSLRLRKYHFKRWLRNRSSPLHSRERFERLDESFRYDVFVSYGPSDESRDWVINVLYPKLTRVTAEDRVFFEEKASPNKALLEELGNAIYSSRKVILVVTADYLEDSRRMDYEVRLMVDHAIEMGELRNGFVLVLSGVDIGERLPKCLRPLLGHNDLTWLEGETEQEVFWLQLQDKLELPSDRPDVSHFPDVPLNMPDVPSEQIAQ